MDVWVVLFCLNAAIVNSVSYASWNQCFHLPKLFFSASLPFFFFWIIVILKVEVFWSKGVKKLAPLFPLLVKGRNLYKMRTYRQVMISKFFIIISETNYILSEFLVGFNLVALEEWIRKIGSTCRKTQTGCCSKRGES